MLDTFEPPKPLDELPLRFPVQDVYRFDDRRIIAGRIETGTLQVGDTLVFSPEQQDQRRRQHRDAGRAPRRQRARRGVDRHHARPSRFSSSAATSPRTSRTRRSRAIASRRASSGWANATSTIGERYKLKLDHAGTRRGDRLHRENHRRLHARKRRRRPRLHRAQRRRRSHHPDPRRARHGQRTIAIRSWAASSSSISATSPAAASSSAAFTPIGRSVKSQNIFWSEGNVTAAKRALRNGHKGAVVWLTGLSRLGQKHDLASARARALQRSACTPTCSTATTSATASTRTSASRPRTARRTSAASPRSRSSWLTPASS